MQERPLLDVIAALDDAFRLAPRPVTIEAWPHCMRDDEIAVLLTRPRRELTERDLMDYGVNVLNTVGDATDLLYFTPRLLEPVRELTDWLDELLGGRASGLTTHG